MPPSALATMLPIPAIFPKPPRMPPMEDVKLVANDLTEPTADESPLVNSLLRSPRTATGLATTLAGILLSQFTKRLQFNCEFFGGHALRLLLSEREEMFPSDLLRADGDRVECAAHVGAVVPERVAVVVVAPPVYLPFRQFACD